MPPPAYARRCRCTGEAITAQEVCFQIVDWHAEDAEVADTDDDGDGPAYTVKAFGVLRDGRSIGVTLTRFTPYFYIKASDLTGGPPMSPPACSRLEAWLTARLKSPAALHSTTLVLRKDFMGFTNYQEEQFLRLCFRTLASFRLAARILGADGGVAIPPLFRGARKLRLYESNVEPLLRLLHTRGLRPCGWARLPARSYVATATLLPSACQVDVQAKWTRIEPMDTDELAPMVVMSYDIECSSSDGSFPQPAKTYVKTAHELYDWYHTQLGSSAFCASDNTAAGVHLAETLAQAFDPRVGAGRVSKLTAKSGADVGRVLDRLLCPRGQHVPMLADIVRGRLEYDECLGRWQQARTKLPKDAVVTHLERKLRSVLPPLEGDRVIQVGVTAHIYGERHVTHRHILTLGTCDAVGDDTVVESFEAEAPLLLRWALLVAELDPDIVVGYNTFGFDDNFLIMRARELGIERDFLAPLGRLRSGCAARYVERMLSSSALGDNSLRYILMPGRVAVDMMKLVQRDHKLDSYKLDAVAQHFTGQKKHDVTPAEIFRLQDGDAVDRAVIARYCVQDCALCNDLAIRLEVVPNAAAMANVCWVPLSWIFLRGQGVKVYSLVARTARLEGFVIPSRDRASYEVQDAGYEGALVLDPREGVYTDPVAVCDYSSLYPSCMISENLSHDCIVLDSRYAHLPNVAYNEVEYEQADGTLQRCRFAHARKGVLPSILEELIRQRQMARQRMACTSDPFLRAVLDGLQLAYKITANSLYGQMGAVTSPLYLRDIAACTTATGRKMILAAKAYMESEHAAQVIYGDSVPGYTPCVVRMSDGRVAVRRIEAIAGDGHWHPCDGGKEACEVWDMEAWTERGWTRIDRIIRHRLASHKRLLRVVTAAGIVDATDDHSLLRSSGHPVSPAAVRPGDTLLQAPYPLIPHVPGWRPDCSVAEQVAVARAQGFAFAGGDQRMYGAASLQDVPDSVPDNVLQASEAVRKAFLLGVHDAACALGSGHPTGGVSVRCSSQLGAQTLAMLASTLRRRTVFTPGPGSAVDVRLLPCRVGDSLDSSDSSSHTNDRSHTSSDSSDSNNVVQEVIVLTTGQGDFVYDLTTANHHFQAGVGSLVVHNTDSIFCVFPNTDDSGKRLEGTEAVRACITTAMNATARFNQGLKAPHSLAYEKTMYPFILLSKKRYTGMLYEADAELCKQKSMGIVLRRRDNANVLKVVYGGVIDALLQQRGVHSAVGYLQQQLEAIRTGCFPLEDLVITKALRGTYKDPERIAHKVLAERMRARDPGSAPQVNDRVPYVYVQTPRAPKGAKLLQGDRIEHPDYVRANPRKVKVDYTFYITNQCMLPVCQLLALVVEQVPGCRKDSAYWASRLRQLRQQLAGDERAARHKLLDEREKEVRELLFEPVLRKLEVARAGNQEITRFFARQ